VRSGPASIRLLQLLNTGHAGTLSTIHANSAKQRSRAVHELRPRERVELPYSAIKTNVADFIEVLVHVERRPGKRFISEVLELHGYNPDADHFDFTPVYVKEDRQ